MVLSEAFMPPLQRKKSAYLENGPFGVLCGQANGIGSGSKFWMPALTVAHTRLHLKVSARNMSTPVNLHSSMDFQSEIQSTCEVATRWKVK